MFKLSLETGCYYLSTSPSHVHFPCTYHQKSRSETFTVKDVQLRHRHSFNSLFKYFTKFHFILWSPRGNILRFITFLLLRLRHRSKSIWSKYFRFDPVSFNFHSSSIENLVIFLVLSYTGHEKSLIYSKNHFDPITCQWQDTKVMRSALVPRQNVALQLLFARFIKDAQENRKPMSVHNGDWIGFQQ